MEPSSFDSPPPPEVLTVAEAAALLRVNRKTIYEMVRHGQLPAQHCGTVIRISRSVLLGWLQAGQARVTPSPRKK